MRNLSPLVTMEKLTLLYFIVHLAVRFAHSAELCSIPDVGFGQCIPITNCPRVLAMVNIARTNAKVMNYVRSLRCGSDQNVIKVCCSDCFTPEGKQGTCVKIQECPNLMSLINSNYNFIRNSMCPSGGYDVCCGPPPSVPIRGNCENQITAFPPNPDTGCCGIEASGENKIFGGTSTRMDQYPWLVLLEYRIKNKISLLCGGSLISNKYVLTAAHCANHSKLVGVRLGEFNITNNEPDCEIGQGGGRDCNNPISIPIKNIIIHPEYNAKLHRNDIALLRLDGAANYTDYIRPICLPILDVSLSMSQSNLKLQVAGWGKISKIKMQSSVKQHVAVPMVDMQDCQNTYQARVRPAPQLWTRQLCAGGEEGRDSCNGDSGGPLMMETARAGDSPVVTIEGIVSYGPQDCGSKGIPGVYTKVYEYNTWIRSQIRP